MSIRDDVLNAARSRSGMTYRLDPPPDGRTTTDCSLLVVDSLRDAGIPIPGVRTAEQIRQATIPVDWPDVKPGDLLFFEHTYDASGPAGPDGRIASHIGFSLGAGSHRMLDAHERAGADVAETDISGDYWQSKLIEARRPPGLVEEQESAPTDMPRGLDVASYQGNPDWAAVAAGGYAFAFTKVTEDTGYVNPTFARNWREIKRVGMTRGAYHFARPEQTDAVAEADYFVSQIESQGPIETGDMLALDLESGAGDLGQWTLDFLRRVEARVGFKPLVYTGTWFTSAHNIAAYPALADYGLWLASYQETMPPPPAPWNTVAFWQQSSNGRVAGIVGDVDVNVFNGTAEQMALYGKPASGSVPVYAQPGDVGTGLLSLMAEDGTAPAMPSTFLPLGRSPALIEECQGMNGTIFRWHLPTGQRWRYPAA